MLRKKLSAKRSSVDKASRASSSSTSTSSSSRVSSPRVSSSPGGDGGNDATYKVLLLGDTGVGKTSMIRSLTGRPFSHTLVTTVGIDFVKEVFDIDGAKVCLQIWDTAGQERFRSMTRCQYRGTKGLLLVYDITNRRSYDTLTYWLESIRQELDASNKDPVPVIVVGNKCDLADERVVSYQEGEQVALSDFQTGFWETSAITGENIRDCFKHLAHAITDINNPQLMNMYRFSLTSSISDVETNNSVNLTPSSSSSLSASAASYHGSKSSSTGSSTIKLQKTSKLTKPKCSSCSS